MIRRDIAKFERPGRIVGGALGLLAATVKPALAHGFGQRYDLPVPLWLWITGAAAAVAFSFVVIGLFVRGAPGLGGYPRGNLLRWLVGRLLAHPAVRLLARVISVLLLVLLVVAGLFGNQDPARNLAPTVIWVLWWVGFAYVSALAGNLWAVVNPWAAVFEWAEALARRGFGRELSIGLRYPSRVGVWPAVGLYLAFAWVELVFTGRAVPRSLGSLAILYSLITWTGMLLFGRSVWLRHGDPFALAFGVLARFAPTEVRVADPEVCRTCPLDCGDGECIDCFDCFAKAPEARREWNLRPFGVGLLRDERVSGSMVAFVVVLLSTVTFDGFTATPAWNMLESALYAALPALGDARLTVIGTLGLLAFPTAVLGVYRTVADRIASAAGTDCSHGELARAFVFTLVPIAIAYHLAHYLTYLLIQGRLIIPLVSDPFGFGWDLFGTAAYRPDIGLVGARFAWYAAVIAIVLGHIVAVYLAHLIALREFREPRVALRSQYPMLALMVSYTTVSLWILAQPIVERA